MLYSPCLSHSPLSQIHCSFISLQIRTSLPMISTKHSIKRCSETKYKPSYQGWTRQPSRKKRVLRPGQKSQRHPPLPLLGLAQKPKAVQSQHACRGPSTSMHDPRLLLQSLWALIPWFCGPCSPGIPNPSGSYNPSSCSSSVFFKPYLMFGCGSLYLLQSVARGNLSDNNWARHLPMSIEEYHIVRIHFIDFFSFDQSCFVLP